MVRPPDGRDGQMAYLVCTKDEDGVWVACGDQVWYEWQEAAALAAELEDDPTVKGCRIIEVCMDREYGPPAPAEQGS